jgi:hypothetical protein
MASATAYKDQGNQAFQNGDYKEAEMLYTKAWERILNHLATLR